MNVFAHVALLGWIPVVLLIFAMLRPRTAAIVAFVGGWLFLPMFGYDVEGLPTFDKASATSIGALLGVTLFDARRLVSFRPHFIDIPMLIWCLCPFASSISNGLGAYDGLSSVTSQVLTWGIPYFIGRLYFSDRDGLMVLARAILIGGVIYIPLCLYEIRMSPQLHRIFYGEHQHTWSMVFRFGGFRPDVFMQHGLMVGLWMACATLVAIWMTAARNPATLWKAPMIVVALALLVTTVLCKSALAIALLAAGIGLVIALKYLRSPALILAAVLIVPGYLTLRLGVGWTGYDLVELVEPMSEERAQSLEYRLDNEELLKTRAMRRPVFGWGGWNRYRVEDSETATDSLWIIALGKHGLLGMVTVFTVLLLPIVMVIVNAKRRGVSIPFRHPIVPIALVLLLFALDCLFNAMVNGVYVVAAGAVAGAAVLIVLPGRRRAAPARRMRRRTAAAPDEPIAVQST